MEKKVCFQNPIKNIGTWPFSVDKCNVIQTFTINEISDLETRSIAIDKCDRETFNIKEIETRPISNKKDDRKTFTINEISDLETRSIYIDKCDRETFNIKEIETRPISNKKDDRKTFTAHEISETETMSVFADKFKTKPFTIDEIENSLLNLRMHSQEDLSSVGLLQFSLKSLAESVPKSLYSKKSESKLFYGPYEHGPLLSQLPEIETKALADAVVENTNSPVSQTCCFSISTILNSSEPSNNLYKRKEMKIAEVHNRSYGKDELFRGDFSPSKHPSLFQPYKASPEWVKKEREATPKRNNRRGNDERLSTRQNAEVTQCSLEHFNDISPSFNKHLPLNGTLPASLHSPGYKIGWSDAHDSQSDEMQERVSMLNETKFKVGFIDSHCHIDFLMKKLHLLNSFDAFVDICKDFDPFPKSFEGCVAVFCDPTSFQKESWWSSILADKRVWGAFGCHPHFADKYGPCEEEFLRHALTHKKVKAVGEMGLDYSGRNQNEPDLQKKVFVRQLKIALELKKPVVIHCRDAFDDCFYILKEMLPKNYIIHKHCFTGDVIEAKQWMDHFPNLYLGFTCLVTNVTPMANAVKRVAQTMPLNRILLETDAPYFRPRFLKSKGDIKKYSHPGMAIHVASAIAQLRNISIETVLEETRRNTTQVYSI